ncbi:MAG TPA: GGDEF domain-containing protein, partial [Chromatiales bacterium]|nr:GGDEF domain-containing protein [Chromatiales bacterium]
LGVVVLASATPFPEGTRTRLEIFRSALSLALRNAIAHDHLQRLSEEFSRAVRADTPLAVLMLDIDHFKSINDTYGHLAGDRALVKVARLVRSLLREGDVLLRYGGEEFMIILPGASCHDAKLMGQRLRHAVEDITVSHGEQSFHLTVSIGAASYPEMNVSNQEEFVHLADERLYRAKQSGRNCVVTQ